MNAATELSRIEDRARDGFPYDEQTASKVIHPERGTLMETFDRKTCVALLREVMIRLGVIERPTEENP